MGDMPDVNRIGIDAILEIYSETSADSLHPSTAIKDCMRNMPTF